MKAIVLAKLGDECLGDIKHNYTLACSLISLVWRIDPIVSVPTAGLLDRKAFLYVVNTLIPSSASPAHVRSRPDSNLT